jgi:GH15 family glucan-1,4-alpha-glucosidase
MGKPAPRIAREPRVAAPVAAIGTRRERGDFLLRRAMAEAFGMPENAFTVCTFWYIDELAANGRKIEARALSGNILARRSQFGLSEGLQPESGAIRGNFRQTAAMAGRIAPAMRPGKSWERAL